MRNSKIFLTLISIFILFCFSSCKQNKSIQFKAALVYQAETPQPVLRTKFYLLNKELKTIEDESGTVFVSPKRILIDKMVGDTFNRQIGIDEDSIKNYIVSSTTTDFEGNGKFEDVPSGTYYICGFTQTKSELGYVLWSYKVNPDTVKDIVILDQNNAYQVEN